LAQITICQFVARRQTRPPRTVEEATVELIRWLTALRQARENNQ
jgi:hypothetical protein